MSWKVVTTIAFALVMSGIFLLRVMPVGVGSEPASAFLDQEVIIPDISSFARTSITVRELENFYRSGPLSNVSWERMDQRRVILHASGQDALTRQTTVLAWQFLRVSSDQEIPLTAQGPKVLGAYVERLALNGEIAPTQVIQMAMFAIIPEIARVRATQKK
jgi:hypothetical protein